MRKCCTRRTADLELAAAGKILSLIRIRNPRELFACIPYIWVFQIALAVSNGSFSIFPSDKNRFHYCKPRDLDKLARNQKPGQVEKCDQTFSRTLQVRLTRGNFAL